MGREFSPELLNSFRGVPAETLPTDSSHQTAQLTVPPAKAEDVRILFLHIENLNKRLKELEARMESNTAKVDEVTAQNKTRFERVQGHFQRQTELLKNGFADVHAKIAQVVSRVNERRVEEGVVKEMVERHAQVVQAFEVRLGQLQRVLSEQELQLMSARSELKEAMHEIARMKRL